MRPQAVARELGLEQRAEEERVVGKLERTDVAEGVVPREPHAAGWEDVDGGRGEAVGAVVALDAALPAHDPLHQRAGREDDPALVPGERALEREDDERGVGATLLVA